MTKEDVEFVKIVNCIYHNKVSIKVDINIHRKMTSTLRNTVRPIVILVLITARENLLQRIHLHKKEIAR